MCEPLLAGNEIKYVTDAVASGWISSAGEYLDRFERQFASYVGAAHGIAVSSGTAALHVALLALGIGPGDEVVLPDFTMISTAFAVCYTGAKPVFVDADPATWTMAADALEGKITPRTRAIMPVHIYGHACDMDAIGAIASRHGLPLIEDAAEAHGALYKGRRCGSLSDIACFSFYANKIITTGEGGMVVTDRDELAERSRYLRNLAFPRHGQRLYVHQEIGFNYRLSNLLAAVGLAQLERIDQYVSARRRNAMAYAARLGRSSRIELAPEADWAWNCYWMYGIVLDEDAACTRDELMVRLAARGIETRTFFVPMHLQPALLAYGADGSGQFPVAARLSTQGLYLPSGSGLSDLDIEYVSDEVLRWTGR